MEAALWILMLSIVIIWWASLLFVSQWKFSDYIEKVTDDSKRISMYNYSKYLVQKTSQAASWYVSFSWNSITTWLNWDYYYDCGVLSWMKIKTTLAYSWVFCQIYFGKEKIYNYRLFNN